MSQSVGIRSLALSLPNIKRTNDYYREKYPELVAQSEQKSLAKLFSVTNNPRNEFDFNMLPYLQDPFRGTVQRWVLAPDESSLMLQERAARQALDAANLTPQEVDLMLVASVWPEKIGFGDAAFLARQLNLQGAAWNIDAACGVTPVALQTACALVRSQEYRHVLVVISCSYSRFFDEDDTLSWFMSDGVGAFVVSSLAPHQGILGTKTIHTAALCDIFFAKLTEDEQGNPQVRMRMDKSANQAIRGTAVEQLRTCCEGAVAAASVTMEQIDFFIFNTSTAWATQFCAQVLGIDVERTINLYHHYANLGPVITVANLYYAAQLNKIHENDLVLIYGLGAAGVASASVMRWGDVALGSMPHLHEFDSVLRQSEEQNLVLC
ncbi:3-oxoacyl-ACP synthase [Anabaena cylindrica FACHB-243]|uniref:3-Oxoacyl-(Acyl-carrier-protein (ACP)) synthase III domain-containing protein n=1 Tax=Anabaena cylindrica (strain ATCC 27899 / PCC 7122) TaxID=272123 RepID=K9ZE06_ANACC|nr:MULTISPECIES: 3-oxoacyl-[acyl-carrier-protein] synthase III C-terminal domain-containing protein [Anabaena]AFZ56817.1 3-Oxoacyl-(acyl-carrier-protein (ACP)) synthase III domain-containing protein [Anabaena cylindrica PCC 7122]MBD2418973.1 3-oxoacyl-ACP synthase [Anabaena cylindrica FACHB-243]MBY5285115.1 3-oxoacyl-ACP synthase [Anabaena sp. CCAP 1446/1C]MBY5308847.1 3-oxoacyl-ACP synthase [Anabaena sp. CCAP 1446/1C]MCM2409494.1 3-oxoacyl-ACP synthase [Anabaena sp. CCAP 1446/1C]